MIKKFATALAVGSMLSTTVFAQVPAATQAPAAEPAVVQVEAQAAPSYAARDAQLPAGTDVVLRLNDQLTSRSHRVGDTFPLTVVNDVTVEDRVVIPAGTRAVGQVTWRTGRGGFGKAGKMEVQLRYIELGGRQIPITGHHRQEGDSNTAGAIGGVLAAGVIGGMLVRGRSATIAQGREFTARTVDAIPVSIGEARLAAIAATYTPTAVASELGRRRDAGASASPRNCVREAQRRAQGQPRRAAELERQCRQQRRTTQS